MTKRSVILSVSLLSLICCSLAPSQDLKHYSDPMSMELQAKSDAISAAFKKYQAIPDLASNTFFTNSPERRAKIIADARQATESYLGARQQYLETLRKSLERTQSRIEQNSGEALRTVAPKIEEEARLTGKQVGEQLDQVNDQIARLSAQKGGDPERMRKSMKAMQDIRERLTEMQKSAAENARRAKRMQEETADIEMVRQQFQASNKEMLAQLPKDIDRLTASRAAYKDYYDALAKIQPVVATGEFSDPRFSWPGGGRFEGGFTYEADKKSKEQLRGISLSLAIAGDGTRSGTALLSLAGSDPIRIDLSGHQKIQDSENMRGVAGNRTFSITLKAGPDRKDPANTVSFTILETTDAPAGAAKIDYADIALRRSNR